MSNITVQEEKLDNLIHQKVARTIREIFNDPDYGLPLASETIKRLKKSAQSKKAGCLIDFEDILKKRA